MTKKQAHKPAADVALLGVEIPPGARCVLIHLNEKPHSTEWLQVLRDYCDSRIEARRAARAGGAIVTPSPAFDWDMTSITKKVGAA